MTATSIQPTNDTERSMRRDTVRDTLTLPRTVAELLRDLTVHEKHQGRPDLTKGDVVADALALYAQHVLDRDGLAQIPPRGDYDLRAGHGRRGR